MSLRTWLCSAAVAAGVAQAGTVPRFEPVQPDLFAAGATLVNAVADYDGDGDLDLFVGFNGTPNHLYRNDKGRFTDVAAAAGVADARPTRAAAWGDFDADGDPDLLVGFAPGAGSVLQLYRNDRGRFVDVTDDAGLAMPPGAVRQPAWVDVDADGDLDLFVGFRDRADVLFRNDGGTLHRHRRVESAWPMHARPSAPCGSTTTRTAISTCTRRTWTAMRTGCIATTPGTSPTSPKQAGVAWGGRAPRDAANGTVRPCAADVDGDGRFDLFMANYGPNGLFLNRGGGTFEDVSAAWGDRDRFALRHVRVRRFRQRRPRRSLRERHGDGRQELSRLPVPQHGDAVRRRHAGEPCRRSKPITARMWVDFDGDGDAGSRAHRIAARTACTCCCATCCPPRTRPAVDRDSRASMRGGMRRAPGAEVRVYAAGTRTLIGTRLVDTGSGYDAQNDMPVHVGLGSVPKVDVEVTWPGGGRRGVTRAAGIRAGTSRVIVLK